VYCPIDYTSDLFALRMVVVQLFQVCNQPLVKFIYQQSVQLLKTFILFIGLSGPTRQKNVRQKNGVFYFSVSHFPSGVRNDDHSPRVCKQFLNAGVEML
jgi:hypothetical protein